MTILSIAIQKAKQSSCRYKVAAIGLNFKGEVIGSATNRPRFDRQYGGLHAEVNLIRRYGKKLKTIIICRVNSNGKVMPIEACPNCLKLASKLGIVIRSVEA